MGAGIMAGFDANQTGFDTLGANSVLSIIADPARAQKALDDFTKARAEIAVANDDLNAKRQAAEADRKALDAATTEVAKLRADLVQKSKDYGVLVAQLDNRSKQLNVQAAGQMATVAELGARDKALAAREAIATAKEADLAKRETGVVAREASIAARVARLSAAISGA